MLASREERSIVASTSSVPFQNWPVNSTLKRHPRVSMLHIQEPRINHDLDVRVRSNDRLFREFSREGQQNRAKITGMANAYREKFLQGGCSIGKTRR